MAVASTPSVAEAIPFSVSAPVWRSMVGASIVVSLIGVVILLVMTRWGIGTSPDSVNYIRAARLLLGEEGSTGVGGAAGESALTHYAPLYPLLLAAGGVLGLQPLEGARWLSAIVFGLNILLVGLIVARSSRNAAWLGVVGSVLMVVSMPVLSTHATALSEPVFLMLVLLGFTFLHLHLQNPSLGRLLGAAVALGLAMFARYAGAACVITGGMCLLVLSSKPLGRRLSDALTFGLVSSLPMAAWMLRSLSAGTVADREILFHPVGRSHAWQALYTASSWMLIPPSAPDVVRLLLLLAMAAGAALFLFRRARGAAMPPVIPALALFIGIYVAFLAVSISFIDANTPLDDRILLPVFVAGLTLALLMLDRLWPAIQRTPAAAPVVLTLGLVFVAGQIVRGFEGMSASYARGWGFTSAAWKQSPTLAQVRTLPEGTLLYSNAPEIVYLHTGRTPRPIPRRRFLMTGQTNRNLTVDLANVARELGEKCGVLVYFRTLDQKSMPTEPELRDRLALKVLSHTADGAMLGATGCQR